jgi:hypothetical protein
MQRTNIHYSATVSTKMFVLQVRSALFINTVPLSICSCIKRV